MLFARQAGAATLLMTLTLCRSCVCRWIRVLPAKSKRLTATPVILDICYLFSTIYYRDTCAGSAAALLLLFCLNQAGPASTKTSIFRSSRQPSSSPGPRRAHFHPERSDRLVPTLSGRFRPGRKGSHLPPVSGYTRGQLLCNTGFQNSPDSAHFR
jgi:hypothetical protein